ncbi:BTAD domain-containing putative transcriptional regulator [Streptomyces sp. NPDC002785]|uniref:BTAD domain-containing putative transcriptional regulator n=1 Tax=Streptomyces sp. NPDC002785 TaxID=3154543 RepID=UPI00332B5671
MISAFGRMTVCLPEGPVELGPPRRRAVLALLLVNAGKVVSISSFVRNIWGTEPPGQAVTTLQSYISRLRKLIADRPLSGGVELQLKHRSPGYVLVVPSEHVDVMRFEQAVRRGVAARHRGEQSEAFGLLSQALRGWDAPPFEDLADYEFAVQEATRLGDLRLTALEECAECAFTLGRSQELLPVLEQEVYLHPMRERLVYQLMRAQYRCGRQADALYTFERTRKYLAGELGADVSPELKQVHENILRHDPSLTPSCSASEPLSGPLPAKSPVTESPVTESPVAESPVAERPVQAAQPAERAGRPAMPTPPAGRDADPPATREREMGRLVAALDTIHRGSGRSVLLVGEAGVGKTWLLQRFGQLCRETDIDVCTVYCPQDDDMPAYWPWSQVLRQAVARRPEAVQTLTPAVRRQVGFLGPEPDVCPATDSCGRPTEAGTFAFRDAVSQVLLALADRPLVLVLENFQRADSSSLALMRFLMEQTVESSLLLIVTSRTFRIADDPDWRAARALVLQLPNAEEIRLEGLSSQESRRTVTAAFGRDADPEMCAVLHDRSGGNPYLLLGLLDAVRSGMSVTHVRELLPPRLREVIMERLSGVPSGVLTVLYACAILSPENTIATVRELAVAGGASAQDVRRAIRTGLLQVDPDDPTRIDFLHPLVRDVVRQEMPGPIRAELHCRTVGLFTAGAVNPEAIARSIARHTRAALQGVPPADAIAPLVAKAEHAMHRFAYSQALRWLSHAAVLVAGPAGEPQYAEAELSVQLRRADAARIVDGDYARSTQAIYDRIDYLGRVLGRPQDLVVAPARILGLLGRAHFAQAETLIPSLLELAARENVPQLRAIAHLGRGIVLHERGRPAEALAELDASLAFSDVTPQNHFAGCRSHIAARRWQVLAHSLNGNSKAARKVHQELVSQVFNEPGYRPVEQVATFYTDSILAVLEDDAHRAIGNGRRAVELAGKTGLKMWWRLHQAPLAWAGARLGAPGPDVLRAARQAVAAAAKDGLALHQTLALGLLADGERHAGRESEAGMYVRQMYEQAMRTGEVAFLPVFFPS